MANVAHSSLTGAELHEPKGVAAASSGQVYVANGAGTGVWTSIDSTSFVGQIADFATPVAPTGWLECDGSDVNTTTYSNLYNILTIQRTGTRSNGSPTITSLSSTTNFKVGFYVFGAGIASGTTILSIDSATQITMSGNASSGGTSTIVVSPWLLNTNTIRLPNLSTSGYYRRALTSSTRVGQTQTDQNKAHTHTGSGTSSSNGDHSHTVSITDPGHTHTINGVGTSYSNGGNPMVRWSPGDPLYGTSGIVAATTGITASSATTGAHTHTYSFTTASSGETEGRPVTMIFMTCIKY